MSDVPPKAYDLEKEMIESEDSDELRHDGDSSSSSSSETNEDNRNTIESGSSSLEGEPSVFEIGSNSPSCVGTPRIRRSGFSLSIAVHTQTARSLFHPVSVERYQKETPREESTLLRGGDLVFPIPAENHELDLILGNQHTMPRCHSQPSRTLGKVNPGRSSSPNHQKFSKSPWDLSLDSSSRPQQLPLIQQQTTTQGEEGGFIFSTQGAQLHEVSGQSAFQASCASNLGQNQGSNLSFPRGHGNGSAMLSGHVDGSFGNCVNKRKISWQDKNYFPQSANLQLGSNLFPDQSQNSQNHISTDQNPRPKSIRNSVYDPLYQRMGLPVDPHLRLFLAKYDFGSGDGF